MREILTHGAKPQTDIQRDGKIIAIVGVQGACKTLTATYLAVLRKLQGDPIYCNYHLYGHFPYHYLDCKDDIFKHLDGIKNSTIIIDEFHAYLDSYEWYKDEVINFTKDKMVTARRKGNWFITVNQLPQQYPLRMRKIIPLWLTPRVSKYAYYKGKKVPKIVIVEEVNKELLTTKFWRFNALDILGLYDTYEDFTHILNDNGEGGQYGFSRKTKKNKRKHNKE